VRDGDDETRDAEEGNLGLLGAGLAGELTNQAVEIAGREQGWSARC